MHHVQVKDVILGGALDAQQLQLKEGQAWKLFLDIYVLDADGCIFDVCLLAAVAALLALKLPKAEVDEDGKVSTAFTSLAGRQIERMTVLQLHRLYLVTLLPL